MHEPQQKFEDKDQLFHGTTSYFTWLQEYNNNKQKKNVKKQMLKNIRLQVAIENCQKYLKANKEMCLPFAEKR